MSDSLLDQYLNSRNKSNTEVAPVAANHVIPVPSIPTVQAANVGNNIVPVFREEQGIIAKYKAKMMDSKSALDVLQVQYKGHLEIVKHNVMEGVKVGKERISVMAEEQLKELDARHLEILGQLGLRNLATRTKILDDANEMIVSKMREVEAKNWPEAMKMEFIQKSFELRQKFIDGLMDGGASN